MNKQRLHTLIGFSFFLLFSCAPSPPALPGSGQPGEHAEHQQTLGVQDVLQEPVTVYTGLDVLEKMNFEPLVGQNVGVVTNHTAVNRNKQHVVDLLYAATDIHVQAIFAPEHGFRGDRAAGDAIGSGFDAKTGIPIHSLYGARRAPDPETLDGIDVLIFDIQDVGARFYTYISTMGYVLEAGAKFDIPVMILDRPNPIGRAINGNILNDGYESFVGRYRIPIRYGLTIGELARLIVGENLIPDLESLELHVVECQGWTGELFWSATDLEWTPPSPNMQTTNQTLTYPGLCLLEGVNINEGRGTAYPFEYLGAPYIDGKTLAHKLNSADLKGFSLKPITYVPVDLPGVAMNPLFEDQEVSGVQVVVTDPANFKAIDFMIYLLAYTRDLYPDSFGWRSSRGVDRLWGGPELREMIDAGSTAEEIIESYQEELRAFSTIRAQYLIY